MLRKGTVRVRVAELSDVCRAALVTAGVPQGTADCVADALVVAELRGLSSHGVRMLLVYLERVRRGGIDPGAVPEVIKTEGGLAWLDGRGGFGQLAATVAGDLAKDLASRHGVSFVLVGNSNHVGALGVYTCRLARVGYVAFMASNANPTVAPFGGREARLGTNPVSVAFPWPTGPGAIVVDLSTSAVAKGKIYEFAARGERIPGGWALDGSGRPTTDAEAALQGVLLPMAGAKGYALAVAVDLLTGVLDGRFIGEEILSLHQSVSRPQGVSFAVAALKPDVFQAPEVLERSVDKYCKYVKGAKPSPGTETVYLPGERELMLEKENRDKGVLLDSELWQALLREAGREMQ